MKMNSQKKKVFKIAIVVLCCLAVIVSSVIGALYLFNGNDSASADYVVDDYNCFAEGFTDVLITDEKSAIEAVGSVDSALGIKDAESELEIISVVPIGHDTYYKMQQIYKGIPVYGKTVVLSANHAGMATALTSNFSALNANLDVNPTITFEEFYVSVKDYLNASSIEVVGFDDSGLVLYEMENKEYLLAYDVVVNGVHIIVDAKTAEVITIVDRYYNAVTACEYSNGTFNGAKISENEYLIGNVDENLYVFNANYQAGLDGSTGSYITHAEKVLPMNSENNYFGDKGDSFESSEYVKAVYLLDKLEKASMYFSKINSQQSTGTIAVINNGYDPTNAFGGFVTAKGVTSYPIPYGDNNIISIFLGSEMCENLEDHLDTIFHEYTHGVSHSHEAFVGNEKESGALDEAYADIFGELLEATLRGGDPNWIHGDRNIANPYLYNNVLHPYPANLKDLHEAKTAKTDKGVTFYCTTSDTVGTDYSHFASTIISHTAYSMWNGIDGNENLKINSDLLAELWYRSLLLLQSDADFSQCRNAVELSARVMLKNGDLTSEQYQCVIQAFDKAGIAHANYTYEKVVKNEFDLSVLSHQQTENVSFNLTIYKQKTYGFDLFGVNIPYRGLEEVHNKNYTKGNIELNLKSGRYVFCITDNADENAEPISVKVVVDGSMSSATDKLVIQTDFWDVTTVLINGNDTSDDWNDIPDKSEPIQIESFLSKKPFVDNKGEFAISFEYGFDTVEAWNGGTLTNFPQAMNDTFCITGDFDHDGIEDSVCSAVAADDDCTRFNFNVKTKNHTYVTDVCPSYAICDVYAYVIKGENEDYLVRESSAKRIVEPDDDESTEDYYLYETIFVYSIKSKTSISYEFFCNKQADGYKFTTSGWDGSRHIGDLIYQSWENSDSKNQICDSESSAIEYIKAALGKSGLSERVMGNGSTNCEIIPICAVNKAMNSDNQGTAILCTNENSKPQTSVDNNDTPEEGYAGNQTAEQLRKSIIGSWGMIGDYTFDTNGICYFGGDRNHPGTYKITENKKLIIDFPWTHNEYTWSELSFDEFHEDHDFDEYFWCITSKGVLRLNGSDYYRDGRIPLD